MYHTLYSTIRFKEKQSYNKGLKFLFIGLGLAAQLLFIKIMFQGSALPSNVVFWAVIPFFAISLVCIYLFKLETHIDSEGIKVRFFPIHMQARAFRWEEIHVAEIRKYCPILEYGGWGIRYSWRKGWAYHMKGKIGIQLTLKNGKSMLIGTQKAEEAQQLLDWYFQPRASHLPDTGQ